MVAYAPAKPVFRKALRFHCLAVRHDANIVNDRTVIHLRYYLGGNLPS